MSRPISCLSNFALLVVLCEFLTNGVFAHGPQLQVTNDGGKIVTREIRLDGPYSDDLSDPKSVYVIPINTQDGIPYVRPNQSIDTITGLPSFVSGPGLAYGYHLADSSLGAFAADSVLSIEFTDGLLLWEGGSFQDAGATELKAYRGSDPAIADPADAFAVTSDEAPFDSVSLSPLASDYDEEAHGSVRFAMLGDGTSLSSDTPDGVYLAALRVTSTQLDLSASDPYFFVLHKNALPQVVDAAIGSLGIDSALVQYVPEPSSLVLMLMALLSTVALRRRSNNMTR